MISTYSRSLPLLSLHLRYMTEASTLAGEKVLGSFRSEITLSKMVLDAETKVSGSIPFGGKNNPEKNKQDIKTLILLIL